MQLVGDQYWNKGLVSDKEDVLSRAFGWRGRRPVSDTLKHFQQFKVNKETVCIFIKLAG